MDIHRTFAEVVFWEAGRLRPVGRIDMTRAFQKPSAPSPTVLASGFFNVVLGSRILGVGALVSGMPAYKYISNRLLTFLQNLLLNYKLSEYHAGYRGFTREVLEDIPFAKNSDDFVFDNEMLSQCIYRGFRIGELSCPTRYFPEASSINFRRSLTYGLGVLRTSIDFRCACFELEHGTIFEGLIRRRPRDVVMDRPPNE